MLAVAGNEKQLIGDAKRSRSQKDSTVPQMMADPFVFVPITQAEAARGRGVAKRIVRAHVTRVQHAKSSSSNGLYDLQAWTVKPYIHPSSTPTSRKSKVKDLTNDKKKRRPGPTSLRSSNSSESDSDKDHSPTDDPRRIESSLPELAVVLPKLLSGGSSDDPFWTYPVDYQPELSPIFAHYIQNVAVEIPDIDGPTEKGLLRRVWFPMCMTDASTMYAVLLMAASHYCAIHPEKAKVIDLLALKSRALSEINNALADPVRATSDSMIGAIAKMAAYEAIFGDSDVFKAHMKGLQMILRMRGQVSGLGLNGLLERMLVWIDLNAVHLVGGEKIFGGENGIVTEVEFDSPDPFHFAGIQ